MTRRVEREVRQRSQPGGLQRRDRPWGTLAACGLTAALLTACGGTASGGGGTSGGGPIPAGKPNPQRSGAPTVDIHFCTPKAAASAADPCWKDATATPLANVMAGAMPSGFAATFQACWNNSNLYVFEPVTNPSGFSAANANTTDPWLSDAMEVYLSGDNGAGSAMGPTDIQFDIPLGQPASVWVTAGGNAGGVAAAVATVKGGYDVLMTIPWPDIQATPGIGQSIGIDPATDTYSDGSTQNQDLAWGSPGTGEQNPSTWGQLVLQK